MTKELSKNSDNRWQCSWGDKLPEYLLGEIQGEDGKRLEKHFNECFYCHEQYWEMQSIINKIQQPSIELNKDLTPQILASIPPCLWNKKRLSSPFLLKAGLLTAFLLWISFLYYIFIMPAKTEKTVERFQSETNITKDSFSTFTSVKTAENKTQPDSEVITASLSWFAENQEVDGSWAPEKFGGKKDYTVALTSMVLLAFLEGKNLSQKITSRGIDYILNQQNSEGLFGPVFDNALYNHGIATLVLLKVYVQDRQNKDLKRPISQAIDYICVHQKPSGGWGYLYSSQDANVSISVWQLQALMLSCSQGWAHAQNNIDMGLVWLQNMINDQGYVGYRKVNDFPYGSETSTAMGAFVLLNSDTTKAISQKNKLEEALKQSASCRTLELDYYNCYFINNALQGIQTDKDLWSNQIRKSLINKQIKNGLYQGTWPPDDRWGQVGGRIYSTALAVLTLQSL